MVLAIGNYFYSGEVRTTRSSSPEYAAPCHDPGSLAAVRRRRSAPRTSRIRLPSPPFPPSPHELHATAWGVLCGAHNIVVLAPLLVCVVSGVPHGSTARAWRTFLCCRAINPQCRHSLPSQPQCASLSLCEHGGTARTCFPLQQTASPVIMPRTTRLTGRDLDDPVLVRGLLQWALLVGFFVTRYILDVLLTPPVLDDVCRGTVHWCAALFKTSWPLLRSCVAPLRPILILQLWRVLNVGILQWACTYACSLRLVLHILSHDSLIAFRIRKRDIWPPLAALATFTRASSGRAKRSAAAWQRGTRGWLCKAVPWAVRIGVIALVSRSFSGGPRPRVVPPAIPARTVAHAHADYRKHSTDLLGVDELVAWIDRCYDGDTCYASDVRWAGGSLPPIFGNNIKVRLLGIDTPEIRGAGCKLEQCLAQRAKTFLEGLIVGTNTAHRLYGCVRDKYFRITCDIIGPAGESAAQALLSSGLAVEYGGGAKQHDWCRPRPTPAMRKHIDACTGNWISWRNGN